MEFDSPDEPGSGKWMDEKTLSMLDNARGFAGIPFIINSGYRSVRQNKRVGGSRNSAHTRGYAADIKVKSTQDRWTIVTALLTVGFCRIGIGRTFVHADNDPSLPNGVMWTY